MLLALLLAAGPAAAQQLPDRVTRVLAGLGVSPDDVSILVEPIAADTPMLSHNAGVPRNPASVMKLVTTWSALEMLGPAYTWPTEVYFLDEFDGAVLHGDLAVKGFGDPFLVAEEMWKLLRGLRGLGLTEIQGDLLLDASHFEVGDVDPGAFDAQPFRTYNVQPHALMSNLKAVRFQFFADHVNNRVRVVAEPPLQNLEIDNRLRLVDGPCSAFQAGVAFNVIDPWPEDMRRVVLEGNFSSRCSGYAMSRTVLTHEAYFFGLFQSLWREIGGRIRGDYAVGIVPESANRVLTWQSRPLGELIRSINKNSNNVMTRQLLLTIGAESGEPPGTVANGRAAIKAFLAARGVDDGSLVIDNGAGLSRDTRVSARLLLNLLQAAAASPYAAEFIASMSLAGEDGTTRSRFNGNGSVLHLKTGRLDHVSAIAGYVHGPSGRDYGVAVLVNAPEAHRGIGQEIEEAVIGWLESEIH